MRASKLLYACLLSGFTLSACAPAFVREDPPNMAEFAAPVEVHNGIHAVTGGTPGAPMVLFIHGTPGSWHAFEDYLRHPRLAGRVYMVAVDRPGFGRSSEVGLEPLLRRQSELLAPLFDLNKASRKVLIVGHSLGGSIGLRAVLDHKAHIGALLSISAALSPEHGRPRWYNRLADMPVIKQLIPDDLHLANEEILPLRDELKAIQPDLASIRIPVTIIQGDEDRLVHPDNAEYAKDELRNATLKVDLVPDAGHFIVWNRVDYVVDEILRLSEYL